MTNQTNDTDGIAYLYAAAVLIKMLISGLISPKIYETAMRKADLKFNSVSFAV
jgi:hypothetical protein